MAHLAPLPTRVIDLGLHEEPLRPRLQITNGDTGQYVAFSHVWGGLIPVRTKIQNLEAHCLNLPMGIIPQSFQDAFIYTRKLGIRYLWIDALCIIQDSQNDWKIECSKMAEVYRNAYLVIAALDAPNSQAGFLARREGPSILPAKLPYITKHGGVFGEMLLQPFGYVAGLREQTRGNNLLQTRAWTLQEYLLSRRTLFMGKTQAYWEYSKRNLTQSQDKLPALAGLARDYNSRNRPSEYLAGHWKRDIIRSLAWETISLGKNTEMYRAPSWSWASTNGIVSFPRDSRPAYDATLVARKIKLNSADPFSGIDFASISLRGRMRIADTIYLESENRITHGWWLNEPVTGDGLGPFSFDRNHGDDFPAQVYCFRLVRLKMSLCHSGVLLLRKIDDGVKVVFERVGYGEVSMKDLHGGRASAEGDWFEGCALESVTII